MEIPASPLAINPLTKPDDGLSEATSNKLSKASHDFEAAFLAEALNHMGLDASKGVQGSQAFSSFLNRAYADKLVERGGIGLSDSIFRALAAREDNE